MFNQNNEEPKLDWMYKGPNSTVDREEYLLGRKIDKTLEQINEEEKQKQQGLTTAIVPSKNRVEHECIPPSIRDFNRAVQAEQVDLSTKLQEDPLVAIKKREEETRRQFLQNPIQLKKLQRALKAQQEKNEKKNKKKSKKKKKKKKSSSSDSDTDDDLDTILMHKFNELKQHLTENDLRDILTGNISDSSEDDDGTKRKQTSNQQSSDRDSEDDKRQDRYNNKRDSRKNPTDRNRNNYRDGGRRSKSPHSSRHHYDSDGSEYSNRRRNYGLVKSDGTKIPFKQPYRQDDKSKKSKTIEEPPPPQSSKSKKRLTDEEKEKLRQEMMENAVWRDKERERNIKRYRKEDEKESKPVKEFDSHFIHKQIMKSTLNASVESRIKSNLNNIQRSSKDMDRNFSKR